MKTEIIPTSPQYQGADKPQPKKPLMKYRLGVLELLFLLLISLIGGVCGNLIINNYPPSWPLADKLIVKNSNDREVVYINKQKNSEEILLTDALNKIKPSVVSFFNKKADNNYQEADFLGSGLILTSDGWLVAAIPNIDLQTDLVAVTTDKKILTVDKIIKDDYSGATFFKSSGSNLTPGQFTDVANVINGDDVYAISNSLFSDLRVSKTAIENNVFHENNEFATTIHPFDYIITTNLSSAYAGAPLINNQGEVLGISYANSLVLPQQYFSEVMIDVISQNIINRPNFNISYINLENEFNNLKGDKGAKITAVNSENTSLQIDDIVTKVDNADITKINNLTQVIQLYQAGDSATFTLLRQGKELDLQVNL